MLEYEIYPPEHNCLGWYVYCGDNEKGEGLYLKVSLIIEGHSRGIGAETYFKTKALAKEATKKFLKSKIDLKEIYGQA